MTTWRHVQAKQSYLFSISFYTPRQLCTWEKSPNLFVTRDRASLLNFITLVS